MTVRRLVPTLAFLLAALVVVAACDAGRPAITPTPAPTPDGALETDELPFPTFDLSSFGFGSF